MSAAVGRSMILLTSTLSGCFSAYRKAQAIASDVSDFLSQVRRPSAISGMLLSLPSSIAAMWAKSEWSGPHHAPDAAPR
jgi:hypothetical protein